VVKLIRQNVKYILRERMRHVLYTLPVALIFGILVSFFVLSGNLYGFLATVVVEVICISILRRMLVKKKILMEDERIFRIKELAARKTLQILYVTLALLLGFFAVFYYRGYGSEYFFICLPLMSILLFTLITELVFRQYYGEVM